MNPLNIGFYGHTNTLVFTYTKDGKFVKKAMQGGIRLMHFATKDALATGHQALNLSIGNGDADSPEYRRDYFALDKHTGPRKQSYAGIRKYLGYEEGTTPHNIFFEATFPEKPQDILFVWDEGYGGLNIPPAALCVWASDKSLPDPVQFSPIAKHTFLILDANVLRQAGAMISQQISWERTAADLVATLQNNPAFSYLLEAKQLLIPFGLDGAVVLVPQGESGPLEAALILTHGGSEGAIYSQKPHLATHAFVFPALGACTALLVASLIHQPDLAPALATPGRDMWEIISMVLEKMANLPDVPNTAVKLGKIMRNILETGESIIKHTNLIDGLENDREEEAEPRTYASHTREWQAFEIPTTTGTVPWTLINGVGSRQLTDVAFDYVQNGPGAMEGLPQFSLGAFTTVDRWEIESYQNIGNLILQYASADSMRPLSIAVFGAPGSGKSFGVTQIAQNILPGKVEKLEFNVSQFLSPTDLAVAFQKVRDVILEGKLPLVFFDEFDSDKDGLALGWVKSFLMPMQDGRFKDESGDHPLGKCILVFAGGTAPSFEGFVAPMESEDPVAKQNFKNIKGPDFVSRLKGTINVLGPNPQSEDDHNYILRRALLLGGLCQRKLDMKGAEPISPAIIRAMLQVPVYKHGARSMEAIFDMSSIVDGRLTPAVLPFHAQLNLHVDAEIFLALVRSHEK